MPTDEGKEFAHESFGLVGFSRYTTSPSQRLFGSAVKVNGGISLTIRRAIRRYDLHQDWFHGREELIEVQMSELQFAQLLTGMNVGFGVPCTIKYVVGKKMDNVPEDTKSTAELVHDEVKEKAEDLGKRLDKATVEMSRVLNECKMPVGTRKAIEHALEMFTQEVRSNMPFLMQQFQEAADDVVTQCKAEVVAFTERTLKAQGLENMKNQAPKLEYNDGGSK